MLATLIAPQFDFRGLPRCLNVFGFFGGGRRGADSAQGLFIMTRDNETCNAAFTHRYPVSRTTSFENRSDNFTGTGSS